MKLEKVGGEIKVAVYHIIVVSGLFLLVWFFSFFAKEGNGEGGRGTGCHERGLDEMLMCGCMIGFQGSSVDGERWKRGVGWEG